MSQVCLRPKRGFDVDCRKVGADVSALQRVIGIPALCTSTAHCGIGSIILTCAHGLLAKSFGYVVKCRIKRVDRSLADELGAEYGLEFSDLLAM